MGFFFPVVDGWKASRPLSCLEKQFVFRPTAMLYIVSTQLLT